VKILVISRMFPNEINPVDGIFVREQLMHLPHDITVRVFAPLDFLYYHKNIDRITKAYRLSDSIEVSHPLVAPHILPTRPFFGLLYFISILRAFLRIRRTFVPDIIHAHTAYPDGFAACLLGKMIRRPVVITEHTGPFETLLRRPWERWGTHYALFNCHAIIAVSSFLKRRIESEGVVTDNVTVIPNGVDTTMFSAPDTSNGRGNRILFIGFLVEIKGLSHLLEAVQILRDRFNADIFLEIVGSGPSEPVLQNLVHAMHLSDRVTFTGFKSHDEVPAMISRADLVVLPSLYETFGITLIEAMAMGKPVVATRCGGPEDIVTEEVGRLVPAKDPLALADAIRYVLDNYGKYRPERISAIAKEKFGFDVVNGRIIDLYGSLLGYESHKRVSP
jgi:glycosyltransferase involved in cell wall biosynthesis